MLARTALVGPLAAWDSEGPGLHDQKHLILRTWHFILFYLLCCPCVTLQAKPAWPRVALTDCSFQLPTAFSQDRGGPWKPVFYQGGGGVWEYPQVEQLTCKFQECTVGVDSATGAVTLSEAEAKAKLEALRSSARQYLLLSSKVFPWQGGHALDLSQRGLSYRFLLKGNRCLILRVVYAGTATLRKDVTPLHKRLVNSFRWI